MHRYTAGLIVYQNLLQDELLRDLSAIFSRLENDERRLQDDPSTLDSIISEVYRQIHKLLELATVYGFDGNLWQNYLAWLLAMTENPFSFACEKRGFRDGSVNQLVLHDLRLIHALFHYRFEPVEQALSINCFSLITHYRALEKEQKNYNWFVSSKVRALSCQLSEAEDEHQMLQVLTAFYQDHGAGVLGLNKAFRLKQAAYQPDGDFDLEPITNTFETTLDDLIGYDSQKQRLMDNTEAFISGRKANNLLLHGESGTGKSTCMKAILNMYHSRGLRMIEIYKHQLNALSWLIAKIKNRNYKFIIYMDDLSFEEFETDYKYLKAVIEGGVEMTPDNILIYATSNRRHLIKETWTDRNDADPDDIHHSDTKEEKISLVNRFGVTIYFPRPDQQVYLDIVRGIALQHPELEMSDDELLEQAKRWGMWHGNISGRRARQFINHLLSQKQDGQQPSHD